MYTCTLHVKATVIKPLFSHRLRNKKRKRTNGGKKIKNPCCMHKSSQLTVVQINYLTLSYLFLVKVVLFVDKSQAQVLIIRSFSALD